MSNPFLQSSDQKPLDHLIRLILCTGMALDLNSSQTQAQDCTVKSLNTKEPQG